MPMRADSSSEWRGGRNTSPCTSFHPDSSPPAPSSRAPSTSSSPRVYLPIKVRSRSKIGISSTFPSLINLMQYLDSDGSVTVKSDPQPQHKCHDQDRCDG